MRSRLITLEDARLEAKRRWGALGGWARDIDMGFGVTRCEVGIRQHRPGGFTRQVTLGKGKTFARAFACADRRLQRPPSGHTNSSRRAIGRGLEQLMIDWEASRGPR